MTNVLTEHTAHKRNTSSFILLDIRGMDAQANKDEYDGGLIDEYDSKMDGKMGLGDGSVGK